MSTTESQPQLGLRERKRRRAMHRIQQTALDLFDAHGYTNVTVEQVAAAAEVSPSSVYRYFGTKETLVLYDEYDPELLGALTDSSTPIVTADQLFAELKATVNHLIAGIDAAEEAHIERRMRYAMTEPAIRAAMSRSIQEGEAQLREVVARRTGADPHDLRVWIAVSALMACFISAVYWWVETGQSGSLSDVLDRASELAPSIGSLRFD